MTGEQHQVQQHEERKQEKGVSQQQNVKVKHYQCSNCEASHTPDDRFCPECGILLKANACIRCGTTTESDWEICPQCGQCLHAECCSFCGAETDMDDAFCSECGNPQTGISCPSCHTLNFRSFCRKCNTPLNTLAHAALEQVRRNPQMEQASALAEELAKLEERLSQIGEEEVKEERIEELSAENCEFVNQYKELLTIFRGQKYEQKKETAKSTPPEPKPKKKFSLNISDKEEAFAQYNAKLEEMKNTLNSLFPDAEMTPQMQRDYYTAVKVEITVKMHVKTKIGWKCNAYGCIHSQPNECAKPFKGGKWIYNYVEQDTQVWIKE